MTVPFTEEEAAEIEARVEEIQIAAGIKMLLFIAATAAYFQKNLFPNWVTQSCPRMTAEKGRTSWVYPYMSPSEQRRQYVAVDWQDPPISAQITEIEVHIDVHRLAIDTGLVGIDGLWDIGLGFLYTGPPDPQIEDRQGFGTVFYWIREFNDIPPKRIVKLPTYYEEAAVVPDRVYRTFGRGET